jgi:hypothetical protein
MENQLKEVQGDSFDSTTYGYACFDLGSFLRINTENLKEGMVYLESRLWDNQLDPRHKDWWLNPRYINR